MEKRVNIVPIRLTDSELSHLNALKEIYSSGGAVVSNSFLFRYGLKRLPHQPLFPVAA